MKLVKNDMYLLLINEEAEIKENTWYENKGLLFLSDCKYDEGNNPNNSNPRVTDFNNSVIAYRKLSKEAKELEGLPLLPPFEEVDIFKLMDKETQKYYINNPEYYSHYIAGYKAAQQSKGQYSLEDMKKAIEMARDVYWDIDNRGFSSNTEGDWSYKYSEEEIIQSLSTQHSSKQFSLEDMLSLINEISFVKTTSKELNSKDYQPFITDEEQNIWTINKDHLLKFIQSLSTQQLPSEFIPTYEYQTREGDWKEVLLPSEWFSMDEGDNPKRLKTITNSGGKEVLCGTYKY